MSRSDLQALRDGNALPHTLRYDELADYHVPFDDLLQSASVEAELGHWLRHRGRVALIGASGTGKSSALAWALAKHSGDGLIPLRIPVALADDETVQTTAGFARHVIRRVAAAGRLSPDEVDELRPLAADSARRRSGGRRRSRRLKLGAGVMAAELARELSSAEQELDEQIRAGEVVAGLESMVDIFRARETEPFLVLEDTDTWVSRPRDAGSSHLAEAFLARNVRMLATELNCGFAIAVHTDYLQLPAFLEIASRLERIRLPALPNPPDDIQRILAHRLKAAGFDMDIAQVFDQGASAALGALYDQTPDVRRVIATAAAALRVAVDDEAFDRVTATAVRAAEAEWAPATTS